MRAGIHPNYTEATVSCACGNSWQTRSTKSEIRVELCPKCHPFYTGEQRIVDSAGQVERFMQRMQNAAEAPRRKKAERRQAKLDQRQRQRRSGDQLLESDASTDDSTTENES
ncbi:MAG: 50S ribosomal protein L31 [Sphaerobacteraceae bacterium]|nr:MAG: 50S ribosomal protein L31 [Sphaerobacteraceae bacterium]